MTKRLLTFLTLLTLFFGVGWAATVTFSYTGSGQAVKSSNGITITISQGTSSTDPATNTYNGSHFRIYKDNDIEIDAGTNIIESVEFTCVSGYANYWQDDEATHGSISVSGTLVTLSNVNASSTTIHHSGSATRITQAVVTYTSGGSPTQPVATPTFSPTAGTYTSAQNVTISCATSGATIHYTTNGSDPTTSSSVYNSAIPVSSTTTIKAMAVKSGMNNSSIATATYTIDTPADGDYIKVTSSDDLTSGEYLIVYEGGSVAFNGNLTTLDAVGNTISVTISNNKIAADPTVDNAIFTYDADAGTLKSHSGYYIGKTASGNGLESSNTTAYTNTISFDTNGNAIITSSGGPTLRYNSASNQKRFRYFGSGQQAIQLYKKVGGVETPEISGNTQFPESTTVTITCAAEGATIYYTTDGTDPTNASTPYTAPFELTSSATVKAIAYVGTKASSVASMEFVKIPTVASVNEILSLTDKATFYYSGTLIAIAQTGTQLYAQDENGKGIYLFGETGQTYSKEAIIPAGWTAKYTANYHGAPEITEMTGMMKDTTATSELIAQEITLNEVTANPYNLFHYAVINGATTDGSTIQVGNQSITIFNRFNVEIPSDNKVYYVYGIPSWYDGKQFIPLEFVEKISGDPTYFLYGTFNNWSQTEGALQFIDNGNGTFTLNNANLPDNVRFKIVKKHGNALLGDYGAANGGSDYGINGGWHTNIPMNGADAYTIQKGGATSFVINSSEMKFDVSREDKMSLRTSADNWVEHAMTQTENGWTITKEMTKDEQFEFADAWDYFGNDWWIQTNHLGTGIALTNEGKHFKIDIDGTAEYKFDVNNAKNQVVINRAYAINTSVVTDPVEKVGGTLAAKIDDQTVTNAYPGETVTLAITTNSGYELTSVTLNGTAIEPDEDVYFFVMEAADANVVANFVAKSYPITVTQVDGTGVVDIPSSATTGQTVNFTVTPPEGYTIISVTASFENNNGGTTAVTITENEGSYSFGMPPFPVTVTVTYEAPAVTVTPPAFYSMSQGLLSDNAYITEDDPIGIFNEEYETDATVYYMIDPESEPTAAQLKADGSVFDYESEGVFLSEGEHHVYAICEYQGALSEVVSITLNVYKAGEWKLVDWDNHYRSNIFDYIIVTADRSKVIGAYVNDHFTAIDCENNVVFAADYRSATVNNDDIKIFNIETEPREGSYGLYDRYLVDTDGTYYNFGEGATVEEGKSQIEVLYDYSTGHMILKAPWPYTGSRTLQYSEGNFSMYLDGIPIVMYYRPRTMTLAELCKESEYNFMGGSDEFTIKDELVAVECTKIDGHVLLWCKDQGNASVEKTTNPDPDNIIDYMRETHFFDHDWDQSNWIMVAFENADVDVIQSYVGSHIKAGTLKGYVNISRQRHSLYTTSKTLELVEDAYTEYTPNLYCAANFLKENHNGNATGHGNYEHLKYFFMNPKIEEICDITFAVWYVDEWGWGYFTLPAATEEYNATDIRGAFSVVWDYNIHGDQSANLTVGQVYKLHAFVREPESVTKDGATVAPQTDVFPGPYNVYPLDFDPEDIITAINDVVDATGKTVAGRKYYNLAGIESDKPFDGVNIIVTTYTDGSRSSSKVLK